MGQEAMRPAPAFYARTGGRLGGLVTILHPPYTTWNLSHVALGAALAPEVDWVRLAGTLAAFFFGTGVAAHALDEWKDRPLRTSLGDRSLLVLTGCGLAMAAGIAVAGAYVISPWVLAWAAVGVLAAVAYPLEIWGRVVHTDLGFALAWGAFPVLVGYWAQTETIGPASVMVAGAATLLSLAQRALSTPARFVRRRVGVAEVGFDTDVGREEWTQARLVSTWERPLRYLVWTVALLAVGLLIGP